MSCGDKVTHNNYPIPIGSFFQEMSLKNAIEEGAIIVVPVDNKDNTVAEDEE